MADSNYVGGMGVHGMVAEQASRRLAECGCAGYDYCYGFNGALGADWEGDEGGFVRKED